MAKKAKTLRKKTKKVVQSTASKATSSRITQSNTVKNLHAAEVKLSKALNILKNLTSRVEAARNKAKESAARAKKNGRAASISVAKRANDTVKLLVISRKDAANKVKLARELVREAKQKLRQEQQEKRLIERKETARQKAVVTFIKNWEREWDRKIKSQEKGKRKQKAAAA